MVQQTTPLDDVARALEFGIPDSLIPTFTRTQGKISESQERQELLRNSLGQATEKAPSVPGAPPRTFRENFGIRELGLNIATVTSALVPGGGGLPTAVKIQQLDDVQAQASRVDIVLEEIIELENQVYWDIYFSNTLQELPFILQAVPGMTAEEFVARTRPEEDTPSQVVDEVRSYIEAINDDLEVKRETARTLVSDLRTGGNVAELYRADPVELTHQQLVDTLIRASTYQRPPDLTAEEQRDLLIELGFSRDEANAQLFDHQRYAADRLEELQQWNEQHKMLFEEGQRIKRQEITSNYKKVLWSRAVGQPALYLLRPYEWWTEALVQPLGVGAAVGIVGASRRLLGVFDWFTPDTIREFRERNLDKSSLTSLERSFNEAYVDIEGLNGPVKAYQATQVAWDTWDTNWWNKLLIEVIGDPLSYMGFGIYTKLAKPIPKLGPAIGAFEAGWIKTTDDVFKRLKHLWIGDVSQSIRGSIGLRLFGAPRTGLGVVPRLDSQFGSRIAREGAALWRFVYGEATHSPLLKATGKQAREIAELAINTSIKNPQAQDALTRVGKMMLGYNVIGRQAAKQLADRLIDVSPEVRNSFARVEADLGTFLENLNFIGEQTQNLGLGTGKFFSKFEESSTAIRDLYGAAKTQENNQIIIDWLRQSRDSIKRTALRNFAEDDTPYQQIRKMHDHITDSYVAARRAEHQIKRFQLGTVQGLMSDIKYVRLPLIQTIDRFYTRPLSRMYLVSGFYPLYNVLETAGKMMLSRYNPFRLGNPHDMDLLIHNIKSGIDLEVAFPGTSGRMLEIGKTRSYFDTEIVDRLPGIQRSAGTGLRATAQNVASHLSPRNYVYRFNIARQLGQAKRFLGDSYLEATGIHPASRLISRMSSSYLRQAFMKELKRQAGHVWEYSHDITRELADEVGIAKLVEDGLLDEGVADSLERAIFFGYMTGDAQFVRGIPDFHDLGNVPHGATEAIVLKYTDMPEIMRHTIMEGSRDGTLNTPAGLDAMREQLKNAAYHQYMTSASVFEQRFQTMAAAIINDPAIDPSEVFNKVVKLKDSMEIFKGALHTTARTTIEYADSIVNSVRRSAFYQDIWDDQITPSVNKVTQLTRQAHVSVRRELSQFMANETDPLKIREYQSWIGLADEMVKYNTTWEVAAREDIALRNKYFHPDGANFALDSDRDYRFWNSFKGEVRQNWDDAESEIRRQQLNVLRHQYNIANTPPPVVPDLSSKDVIDTIDVSKLLGLTSADVESNLFLTELKIYMPREDFISEIYHTASLASQQRGLNADRLGWTQERIGAVYDSMMSKFTSNPEVASLMEPMNTQINSVLQEVSTLNINRGAMVNPEAEAAYRRLAERAAQEIERRELIIPTQVETFSVNMDLPEFNPALRRFFEQGDGTAGDNLRLLSDNELTEVRAAIEGGHLPREVLVRQPRTLEGSYNEFDYFVNKEFFPRTEDVDTYRTLSGETNEAFRPLSRIRELAESDEAFNTFFNEHLAPVYELSQNIEQFRNRPQRRITQIEKLRDELDTAYSRIIDGNDVYFDNAYSVILRLDLLETGIEEYKQLPRRVSARVDVTEEVIDKGDIGEELLDDISYFARSLGMNYNIPVQANQRAAYMRRLRAGITDDKVAEIRQTAIDYATEGQQVLEEIQGIFDERIIADQERIIAKNLALIERIDRQGAEGILGELDALTNQYSELPDTPRSVQRERTQTVVNPEQAELWSYLQQHIDAIDPANFSFAPSGRMAESVIENVIALTQKFPDRVVPNGGQRVFHGARTPTLIRNLRAVVPDFRVQNLDKELSIPSVYISIDRGVAGQYSREFMGNFRPSAIYDADLNVPPEQIKYISRSSVFRNEAEDAELKKAIDEGYKVLAFGSRGNHQEYIVLDESLVNIRGVSTPEGYIDMEDIPKQLNFENTLGLDAPDVIAPVGQPISRHNRDIAAHQTLVSNEYQQIRESALQEANVQYSLDFPDYNNNNMVSSVMKLIYPFWGYESHRWAWWLPREFIRHPGVGLGWGKYQDNTDSGYIDIPGPLDVSPFRGTIFMGGARRLMQRDYPEYYDQFGGVAEMLDFNSRFGFYAGGIVPAAMSVFGASAGGPQLAEILPPAARTVQGALTALLPNSAPVIALNEVVFSDRFRNYQIALQISRDSINAALGGTELKTLLRRQHEGKATEADRAILDEISVAPNGSLILLKLLDNIPLKPEEQAAWNRGARGIGKLQPLMEQTGIFRFNPEERTLLRELSLEITEELTGVDRGVLEDMRRYGIRWEDVYGARDPNLKLALNNLELYTHFNTATALLPPQQGIAQSRIRGFWDTVNTRRERLTEELKVIEYDFVRGRETYGNWDAALSDKVQNSVNLIDELRQTPVYADVPVTMQERIEYGDKTGVKVIFHPLEELRAYFYDIPLEEEYSDELGRRVKNYNKFYLEREAVLSALPEKEKQQFIDFINRNDTPVERLRYEVWKEFIRPYRLIDDITRQQFSEEEQVIIARSFTAQGDELTSLQQATTEGGDGVIATYTRERTAARQALRRSDPELDSWLLFFGLVDKAASEAGNNLYNQKRARMIADESVIALLRDIVPSYANLPESDYTNLTQPTTP